MFTAILVSFINLFVLVFNILILARVVMSWVSPNSSGAAGRFIIEVTEPVLAPIRRLLPRTGMFDLSPLVAFFALQILAEVVNRLLASQ